MIEKPTWIKTMRKDHEARSIYAHKTWDYKENEQYLTLLKTYVAARNINN